MTKCENEAEELTEEEEEELDDLMERQLKEQKRPDHRRNDGYERRRIYRGVVTKKK
jgi:hypothetical protein